MARSAYRIRPRCNGKPQLTTNNFACYIEPIATWLAHPAAPAMPLSKITTPDSPALAELCDKLAAAGADLDRTGRWPAEQLRWCGEAGVFEWFMDPRWGGQGWSDEQTVRGYLALASACLTTTFILTQRTGACRRIAGCENEALKERLLPGLVSGQLFATVGISHLTTSRRHLGKPALTAEETSTGFRLDGLSPWVTGAAAADAIVVAAVATEKGEPTDRELLIVVPKDAPGLSVADPLPLVGLSASSTGPVHLKGVELSRDWLIAGPVPNVMQSGIGGSTGGYETTALAIGLAQAALELSGNRSGPPTRDPVAARRPHRRTRAIAKRPTIGCAWRRRLLQGVAPPASQHVRPPGNPGGPLRRKRNRLCRGSPGRPLVPRGFVLPGLELPAARRQRQPLRIGRNPRLEHRPHALSTNRFPDQPHPSAQLPDHQSTALLSVRPTKPLEGWLKEVLKRSADRVDIRSARGINCRCRLLSARNRNQRILLGRCEDEGWR